MFALTPCQCMTMNAAQDADRQRDDGDQRRAQVEQEHRADQRDDDELLDQLGAQVVDGAVDELGAVVGLDHLDARAAGWASALSSLALTASMVVRAFLPERMTTTPPATSPWPSSSAMPRRISGPIWTVATSRSSTGVAPADRQRDAAEVVERLQEAARADHVLGLGQLDDRAARGLVGLLQRLHHHAPA